MLCFAATPQNASAQTPQDLQKELEQMKKDYETRISGLEQRIAQLEASPAGASEAKPELPATTAVSKPAVAAPPSATAQTIPDVTQKPGQNLWRIVSNGQSSAAALQEQVGSGLEYDQLRDADTRLTTKRKSQNMLKRRNRLARGNLSTIKSKLMVFLRAEKSDSYVALAVLIHGLNSVGRQYDCHLGRSR